MNVNGCSLFQYTTSHEQRSHVPQVQPLGNTVDLQRASYSNRIGESEFAVIWRDPDFDPRRPAFYYLRVLEIPWALPSGRRLTAHTTTSKISPMQCRWWRRKGPTVLLSGIPRCRDSSSLRDMEESLVSLGEVEPVLRPGFSLRK